MIWIIRRFSVDRFEVIYFFRCVWVRVLNCCEIVDFDRLEFVFVGMFVLGRCIVCFILCVVMFISIRFIVYCFS